MGYKKGRGIKKETAEKIVKLYEIFTWVCAIVGTIIMIIAILLEVEKF